MIQGAGGTPDSSTRTAHESDRFFIAHRQRGLHGLPRQRHLPPLPTTLVGSRFATETSQIWEAFVLAPSGVGICNMCGSTFLKPRGKDLKWEPCLARGFGLGHLRPAMSPLLRRKTRRPGGVDKVPHGAGRLDDPARHFPPPPSLCSQPDGPLCAAALVLNATRRVPWACESGALRTPWELHVGEQQAGFQRDKGRTTKVTCPHGVSTPGCRGGS